MASARDSAGSRSTFRPWRARRSAVAGPMATSLTPLRSLMSPLPAMSRRMKKSTPFALVKMIQSYVPASATALSSGP